MAIKDFHVDGWKKAINEESAELRIYRTEKFFNICFIFVDDE